MTKKLMNKIFSFMPMPVTLITVTGKNEKADIITVEYVNVLCFEPVYIGLGIEAASFAHEQLEKRPEFVVNLVNEDMVYEADLVGKISDKNVDKFEQARLTAQPGKTVRAPLILEAPVSIECIVKEVLRLGTHDLYLGLATATHVEESILDIETINVAKLRPVASAGGAYWSLGRELGKLNQMIA